MIKSLNLILFDLRLGHSLLFLSCAHQENGFLIHLILLYQMRVDYHNWRHLFGHFYKVNRRLQELKLLFVHLLENLRETFEVFSNLLFDIEHSPVGAHNFLVQKTTVPFMVLLVLNQNLVDIICLIIYFLSDRFVHFPIFFKVVRIRLEREQIVWRYHLFEMGELIADIGDQRSKSLIDSILLLNFFFHSVHFSLLYEFNGLCFLTVVFTEVRIIIDFRS